MSDETISDRVEQLLPEALPEYDVDTRQGRNGIVEYDVRYPDDQVGDTLAVDPHNIEEQIESLERLIDTAQAGINVLQEVKDDD